MNIDIDMSWKTWIFLLILLFMMFPIGSFLSNGTALQIVTYDNYTCPPVYNAYFGFYNLEEKRNITTSYCLYMMDCFINSSLEGCNSVECNWCCCYNKTICDCSLMNCYNDEGYFDNLAHIKKLYNKNLIGG